MFDIGSSIMFQVKDALQVYEGLYGYLAEGTKVE
jgi:hypothetical protein